jgi:hypothetical protein
MNLRCIGGFDGYDLLKIIGNEDIKFITSFFAFILK